MPLRKLEGHKGIVWCVAISEKGQYIASGSADKTIKIWDTASGQCIQTILGHESMIMCVDFSHDGRWLVSSSTEHTVIVWALSTADSVTARQHLRRRIFGVSVVKFSPDCLKIVSTCWDNTLAIWCPQTGQQLQTCSGHEEYAKCASWSPDSKLVASGGGDRNVLVWSADDGTLATKPLLGHLGSVMSVKFGSDASLLVSGGEDRVILTWRLSAEEKKGTLMHRLEGILRDVCSIALCPYDRYMASGGENEIVRIWEVATGKLVRVLGGHAETCRVLSVAWSSDNEYLVSGGTDKTLCLWTADVQVSQRLLA
jgi:WD40 repeat protein